MVTTKIKPDVSVKYLYIHKINLYVLHIKPLKYYKIAQEYKKKIKTKRFHKTILPDFTIELQQEPMIYDVISSLYIFIRATSSLSWLSSLLLAVFPMAMSLCNKSNEFCLNSKRWPLCSLKNVSLDNAVGSEIKQHTWVWKLKNCEKWHFHIRDTYIYFMKENQIHFMNFTLMKKRDGKNTYRQF